MRMLAAIVRAALADEALATGLKGRIAEMQDRLDRLQDCAAKRRQIAKEVMIELDIKKITAPDFTVSIRPGMPSLLVIDEAGGAEHLLAAGGPQAQAPGAPQRAQTGQRDHRRYPLQSGAGVEREDTVMGFSDKQLKALRRNLDHRRVRTRSPMAASFPISKAGTRSRKPIGSLALMPGAGRPLKSRCVLSRENRGAFLAVYTAKVRITVKPTG